MANECVLIYETSVPIPFTVSNSLGVEKGTILRLLDPATVSAADAKLDIPGGIAVNEKIASDGVVKLSVYRGGIFKGTISGSVTVGDALVISGPSPNNLLQTATINDEQVIGTALETGTNAETILFELNPRVMNLA